MSLPISRWEEFKYPVGYLPPKTRILDPDVLSSFQPFERPYVITDIHGEPNVDPNAPIAIRRLKNGRCQNLQSAIRFLELGGAPNESMEATYRREDRIADACNLSEAGFHGAAIDLSRQLPEPFQRTAASLEPLVASLEAQSGFDEALVEVRRLIDSIDVTEYARTVHRLKEAELLLNLGRLEESKLILDRGRVEFRGMYQYYGVRAAAALMQNDEALARGLIVKAGRVNPNHCFKILWNPLLRPLEAFIRRELLTDTGKPRIYEQNQGMHRICNRAQGALLAGEKERARDIGESFLLHRITEWAAAEEAVLALVGLGAFDTIVDVGSVLPGARMETVMLARRLALAIRDGGDLDLSDLEDGWDHQVTELLVQVVTALKREENWRLSPTFEMPLIEVAHEWNDDGRDVFVIHVADSRFRLSKMREPRRRRQKCWASTDLRTVFCMIETSEFESPAAVEEWIEEKLNANAALSPESFTRWVYEIHIDGWSLLATLKPSSTFTPLLFEAWEIAREDPNFYFCNGPARSFGLRSSFALRLLRMLSLNCATRG